MIKTIDNWNEYELLNCGNNEKIEKFGNVIIKRPEPQAMWPVNYDEYLNDIDAIYHRSNKGGGFWEYKKKIPDHWVINYKDLKFKISLTNFKHTGLFPEQSINWDWMYNLIKSANREIRVLNLFAYTGAATLMCSKAGASEVVHVDASKGMINWTKENAKLSDLENNKIRFIVDDCLKFIDREIKRGRTYHAIIMDPPSYGRGPNSEMWKLEDNLYELIFKASLLLDSNPLFFLVNIYSPGFYHNSLENILKLTVSKKYPNGKIDVSEIGIRTKNSDLILPCGVVGRWEKL